MITQTIFPRLANNELILINKERWRAEFTQGKNRYYTFVYLGENGLKDFVRSEQEVSNAIIKKQIKSITTS